MKLKEILNEYNSSLGAEAGRMGAEMMQSHMRREYGNDTNYGGRADSTVTTDALFLSLLTNTAKNIRDTAYGLKWITTDAKKTAKLTELGLKKVPKDMYDFTDLTQELEHLAGEIKATTLYTAAKSNLMKHLKK